MKLHLSLPAVLFSAVACRLVWSSAAVDDDCYNSTYAILMAQTQGTQDFILCPNTTIDVGVPANPQFTDFVNGDFPLVILGDNVTVQCGSDGSSKNNCVLNGGFIQLVATPNNPLFPGTLTSNDLRIQGLTFSGTLQGPPGFGDTVAATAVSLGSVGTNMILEDCIFSNLSAYQTVFLGNDPLSSPEDLLPMQSSLIISNSVFTDVMYEGQVIHVDQQTLTLHGTRLDRIRKQDCGCNASYLLYVEDGSMTIEDSSISNVEVLTSVVGVYGNKTEFSTSGLAVTETTIINKDSRPEDDYCEKGVIMEREANGGFDECLLLGDSTDDETSACGPALVWPALAGVVIATAATCFGIWI